MSENLISEHELRVFEAVKENGGWMTAKLVAAAADVADRTSRAHCGALAEVGVFQVAKVFGGYRYRLSSQMDDAAKRYLGEIEAAKTIMRRLFRKFAV